MCCPPVNQFEAREMSPKLAAEIVRLMAEPTPQDFTDKVVSIVDARRNLICLCEDAEIFADPSEALLEAEQKFWEGR